MTHLELISGIQDLMDDACLENRENRNACAKSKFRGDCRDCFDCPERDECSHFEELRGIREMEILLRPMKVKLFEMGWSSKKWNLYDEWSLFA